MYSQGILLLSLLISPLQTMLIHSETGRYYTCKYELETGHETRDEAQLACERKHGKLAVIESEEDNAQVVALLAAGETSVAWIGFEDRRKQQGDGAELQEYSRLEGRRKKAAKGSHVLVTVNGPWVTAKSERTAPFVCSVGKQFMLIQQSMTRQFGADKCMQEGMSLARITSQRQGVQAGRQFSAQLGDKKWIWVDGEKKEEKWQWSDGSPVLPNFSWQKESKRPRTNPNIESAYVSMNKDTGRVIAEHGNYFRPALCQCAEQGPIPQQDYGQINSQGKYVPLFRSPTGTGRHGMQTRNETMNKYTYHRHRLTHGKAQASCRRRGGDLACPRSPQQQQQILKVVKSNVWLGVVDVDVEGEWRCIGGKKLSYSNWYQGFGAGARHEPDNMTDRMKPGAAYVQLMHDLNRGWRHGRWIDRGAPQYDFLVKSAFVCENV